MYISIAHELQRQQLVNAYNKAVKRKDWKSAKNYRDELSILIAQKNMYESGDTLIEVVNTLHSGKAVGSKDVDLIVFYAGEKRAENNYFERVK